MMDDTDDRLLAFPDMIEGVLDVELVVEVMDVRRCGRSQ